MHVDAGMRFSVNFGHENFFHESDMFYTKTPIAPCYCQMMG